MLRDTFHVAQKVIFTLFAHGPQLTAGKEYACHRVYLFAGNVMSQEFFQL